MSFNLVFRDPSVVHIFFPAVGSLIRYLFLLTEDNNSTAEICTSGSLAITLFGCFW